MRSDDDFPRCMTAAVLWWPDSGSLQHGSVWGVPYDEAGDIVKLLHTHDEGLLMRRFLANALILLHE